MDLVNPVRNVLLRNQPYSPASLHHSCLRVIARQVLERLFDLSEIQQFTRRDNLIERRTIGFMIHNFFLNASYGQYMEAVNSLPLPPALRSNLIDNFANHFMEYLCDVGGLFIYDNGRFREAAIRMRFNNPSVPGYNADTSAFFKFTHTYECWHTDVLTVEISYIIYEDRAFFNLSAISCGDDI